MISHWITNDYNLHINLTIKNNYHVIHNIYHMFGAATSVELSIISTIPWYSMIFNDIAAAMIKQHIIFMMIDKYLPSSMILFLQTLFVCHICIRYAIVRVSSILLHTQRYCIMLTSHITPYDKHNTNRSEHKCIHLLTLKH